MAEEGPSREAGSTAEAEPTPDTGAAREKGPSFWRDITASRPVLARSGLGMLVIAIAAGAFLLAGPKLPGGEAVVEIPQGATFQESVEILEAEQVIGRPGLFTAYARVRGVDRSVKAGTYRLWRGAPYREVLDILTEGRVVTYPMMIPEGFTLVAMAGRIAVAAGSDSARVAEYLASQSHASWDVPGPGLEGYLFPDTYRFAEGVGVERVVSAMIDAYQAFWTPERRELLAASGMSEREAVTLASIIQAEAGNTPEMPTISSVYHNRLRIGMLLQADPTVQYALGGHRSRLLYAAIDSAADSPYSTYHHPGLPPGPIGAPGATALSAALAPDTTDYLYFVAGPDGSHLFSRSLREHNNTVNRVRRGR